MTAVQSVDTTIQLKTAERLAQQWGSGTAIANEHPHRFVAHRANWDAFSSFYRRDEVIHMFGDGSMAYLLIGPMGIWASAECFRVIESRKDFNVLVEDASFTNPNHEWWKTAPCIRYCENLHLEINGATTEVTFFDVLTKHLRNHKGAELRTLQQRLLDGEAVSVELKYQQEASATLRFEKQLVAQA